MRKLPPKKEKIELIFFEFKFPLNSVCRLTKTMSMTNERQIIEDCLRALNSIPHVTAAFIAADAIPVSGDDGKLVVKSGGKETVLKASVKRALPKQHVSLAVEEASRGGRGDAILLVGETSAETRRMLDAAQMNFVDAAGNMRVALPPAIHFVVEGRTRKPILNLLTQSRLKLLAVLICDPDGQAMIPTEDLADCAGVSTGTVSTLRQALHDQLFVVPEEFTRRDVRGRRLLYDIFRLGYLQTLRPKLVVGRFRTVGGESLGKFAERLRGLNRESYLLSGELAASLRTGYLEPRSAVVWARPEVLSELSQICRIVPDEQGNVTVLDLYTNSGIPLGEEDRNTWEGHPYLAHPYLVHAELFHSPPDPRILETAARIEHAHPDLFPDKVAR